MLPLSIGDAIPMVRRYIKSGVDSTSVADEWIAATDRYLELHIKRSAKEEKRTDALVKMGKLDRAGALKPVATISRFSLPDDIVATFCEICQVSSCPDAEALTARPPALSPDPKYAPGRNYPPGKYIP